MAYSYLRPNRDQPLLLPPDVRDWLPEDHLVWFVLDVVTMVDLAAFRKRHPNDGVGRRAYDPAMMLAVLMNSVAPIAAMSSFGYFHAALP